MSSGEKKGWEMLADLAPGDVCKRAKAGFDEASGCYRVRSFGWEVSVSARDKKMSGHSHESDQLLQRFGYFSILSVLWYLVSVRDIPLTGELIRPVNLKGGQLFFRGTHVLPLDKVAERYGNDTDKFLEKGHSLGGTKEQYGDASIRLYPLPNVPVVLILWKEDDEFPARVDLLFDRNCDLILPLDIIWSIAMLSLLIML